MAGFTIKNPIDWDKWFQLTSPAQTDAFERCSDECACEDECEDDDEDLRLALADAAISLAEANRVLAELIDRIYGDQ